MGTSDRVRRIGPRKRSGPRGRSAEPTSPRGPVGGFGRTAAAHALTWATRCGPTPDGGLDSRRRARPVRGPAGSGHAEYWRRRPPPPEVPDCCSDYRAGSCCGRPTGRSWHCWSRTRPAPHGRSTASREGRSAFRTKVVSPNSRARKRYVSAWLAWPIQPASLRRTSAGPTTPAAKSACMRFRRRRIRRTLPRASRRRA